MSSREKSEGKTLAGENETNIISLKFRRWRCEPEPKPVYRQSSFREETKGDDFFGDDLSEEQGFYGFRGSNTRGMAKGMAKGGLPTGSRDISGGATVSGGRHVDNIQTTYTSDTFTPIEGEVEFLIQLVCTQTDEEKYAANRALQTVEIRRKLLEQRKGHTSQINYHQGRISYESGVIADIDNQLQQYAYLGSSRKII